MIHFKNILQNVSVLIVGFIFAGIGKALDLFFGIHGFSSNIILCIGVILLAIGFTIRVWATYYFYKANLKVIVLHAQKKLITGGPFKYSRNPLYLGGNVFIFLGASFVLGTTIGIIMTIVHLPLLNYMIIREEKQLEKKFGKQWISYKKQVRRWI